MGCVLPSSMPHAMRCGASPGLIPPRLQAPGPGADLAHIPYRVGQVTPRFRVRSGRLRWWSALLVAGVGVAVSLRPGAAPAVARTRADLCEASVTPTFAIQGALPASALAGRSVEEI